MCREAVAKGVTTGGFAQAGSADRQFDRVLEVFLRNMMATGLAAAWIDAEFGCRENVLPCPGPGGIDVFAIRSVRQVNRTVSSSEILAVQFLDARKMCLKGMLQSRRQDREARLLSFAFLNGDAVVSKVDVFHPESRSLQNTKTATVKELGHEAIITFEVSKDSACFASTKNDREPGRAPNPLDAGNEFEFAIKDLLVKEQQSAEGLVLCGGSDSAINRQMAEEGGDFFLTHLVGVTFFVEQDEAADPVHVSLLGANAVALDAEMPADAVEEFAWRRAGGRRWRIFCDANRREAVEGCWLRVVGKNRCAAGVLGPWLFAPRSFKSRLPPLVDWND